MVFRFALDNRISRAAWLLVVALGLGLLARAAFKQFIVGTLDDERLAAATATLRIAAEFYPDSARLRARLARAATRGDAGDWRLAERSIAAAIADAPYDYRHRLLLAAIEERRGAPERAAQTLDEARRLAPHYSEVHWQVANAHLRAGAFEPALTHFQTAVEANPSLGNPAIDLVWNWTNGADLRALQRLVENSPPERVSLARFLIKRERIGEASEILAAVDGKTARAFWETSPLINELIEKNRPRLARALWMKARESDAAPERERLVWDGGFERENLHNFNQFEWQLSHGDAARVSVDDRASRSGANALLIDFLGRGAARLDAEIRQRVAVRAGATYQLEFFVKTENFHAPEGVRVAVSDQTGKWNVFAAPVPNGSDDWRRVNFVFTAPKTSATGETALFISVKRQPKSAAEDPTRGRVWFDDFALTERGGK